MSAHRLSRCLLVSAASTALLLLAAALPPTAHASDASDASENPAKPAPQGMAPAQPSAAEMQAMMAAASPGEHHKRLGRFVGHWSTHTKMWMAPGAPPAESEGTMDSEWMMGGRYVVTHHKGNMMGMAFEGQETDGYDNVTGKYVLSWIDNMGTGIMSLTGACDDADCKAVTMSGDMVDPMTKQKGTFKSTTTWLTPSSFKYEAWFTGATGESMKMMEVAATKR
ncbi:MAG: DUF1579 domain-containing protein [Acidobacteriota bacterium]|nr:DUF1579 domain-containing protein [Acidobacteriota bacterium]